MQDDWEAVEIGTPHLYPCRDPRLVAGQPFLAEIRGWLLGSFPVWIVFLYFRFYFAFPSL